MDGFCPSARALLDASCAAVGILDEHCQDRLRRFAAAGAETASAEAWAGIPARGAALGLAATERQRTRLVAPSLADAGLPEFHPHVGAFLAVPLTSAFHSYGWVYWTRQPGATPFTADDEQVAAIVAGQLAVALENLTLLDEVQTHAAQLRLEVGERRRAEMALEEAGRRTSPSSSPAGSRWRASAR